MRMSRGERGCANRETWRSPTERWRLRTSGHTTELLVRVVELDVRHDQLAILRTEAPESSSIASVPFVCQRTVERRRGAVDERVRQRVVGPASRKTPMFVADAVANRFA